MLISKADLHRYAGVSRAAITNVCKPGKLLADGLVNDQIDLGAECVRVYLRKKGVDPDEIEKKHGGGIVIDGTQQSKLPASDVDPEEFLNKTLRQIVDEFGTEERFAKWIGARKTIAEIREKDLKNAKTAGELVNRELVSRGIIEPIDAAHMKLLTDGAKTIAARVCAMHDSGKDMNEKTLFVSKQISSFIKPVKSKVARAMKKLS